MKIKAIKGIIFDVDDTLQKTRQTKYKAHKVAAKKFYNLELTDEIITTHWGKPFHVFIRDLYGEVDSVEKIIANYMSLVDNFPNAAYEDAISVIDTLSASYPLGLLTAGSRELISKDLNVTGFNLKKFAYIQTSEDTSVHKPDPDVFLPILKHFRKAKILPENLLYVGDAVSDYIASTKAGMQFVGIADRTISYKEFIKHTPHVVRSLSEIITMLST